MSDLIQAIIKTRKDTADIFTKSLKDIDGLSEVEICDKILFEVKDCKEMFPKGWYDPPEKGVAVLLDQKPFKRLEFNSLRNPVFWPKKDFRFDKETVGIIYFSPVERKTNMIGDIGFTLYKGEDDRIKKHIKESYIAILRIAEHATVGMKFSELSAFASNLLKDKLRITEWKTTNSDSTKMNFGHSIPGSFESNFVFGNTFEEIKDNIRTKRLYVNEIEDFEIPKTCAFTVESRLKDRDDDSFPNTFFHFIVCFDDGRKMILNNFGEIFKNVGMDYMNTI